MKRRIPIFLGAVWLLLVLVLASGDGIRWKKEQNMVSCQTGLSSENMVYASDRLKNGGILYQMDTEGEVKNLFLSDKYEVGSYIEEISLRENLYGVLVTTCTYEGAAKTAYRILKFDDQLIPVSESPLLVVEQEGRLTGFSVDSAGFYLTLVSEAGKIAYAYQADIGLMQEAGVGRNAKGDNTMEVLPVLSVENSPEGRLIVESRFQDGQFLVRLDDGTGMEDFVVSEQVQTAFFYRNLSVMQVLKLHQDKLVLYAQILLLGYVILALSVLFLRNRSHIVYTIAVVEIILLAVTALGAVFVYGIQERTRQDESNRFGYYYLEELAQRLGTLDSAWMEDISFYDSENYYRIRNQLSDFAGVGGISEFIEDACVVRAADGKIMASASGKNRENVEWVYSFGIDSMLQDLVKGDRRANAGIVIQGEPYQVLGISGKGTLKPEYLLLGVTGRPEQAQATAANVRSYLLFAEIIFLVGSVLCIAILFLQNRELRRLGLAMQAVADGNESVEKAAIHSRDVDWMWNSLMEIRKNIVHMEYMKQQIFKSCYRFAPKRVETILGKDSITEVKSGDSVQLSGTMAIFASKKPAILKPRMTKAVNQLMELIEKLIENRNGYFAPSRGSIASMKLLFLDECRETIDFGVEIIHELTNYVSSRALLPSILLHYSKYEFGLVGTEEQCFPFVFTVGMDFLDRYTEWLEEMGLQLVITEAVKNREQRKVSCRHIGYISIPQNNEKLKLYEVLDVCSMQERRKKQDLDDCFQQGLQLFYQHDFFLARSTFSDVLRECPEDQVAKWYLFTCEKYLNQSYTGTFCYELRDEDMDI